MVRKLLGTLQRGSKITRSLASSAAGYIISTKGSFSLEYVFLCHFPESSSLWSIIEKEEVEHHNLALSQSVPQETELGHLGGKNVMKASDSYFP